MPTEKKNAFVTGNASEKEIDKQARGDPNGKVCAKFERGKRRNECSGWGGGGVRNKRKF